MTTLKALKSVGLFFVLIFVLSGCSKKPDVEQMLTDILSGDHRNPAYVERDKFRNPVETLLFFGVKPNQSLVEITPGFGWYTEIIGPFLNEEGVYYPASLELHDDINPFFVKMDKAFGEKLEANKEVYGNARWIKFMPSAPEFAPEFPVDMVLTFRNVHNWAKAGTAESMFEGFSKALKKGGVLGVVEHRAKPGTPLEEQIRSGYMTVDYVVQQAKNAGFRLDASSEINANPKDTADHPGGVWNLQPSSRNIPEGLEESMLAIGESDRMTLRFIKE